jgi:hypothetical protein
VFLKDSSEGQTYEDVEDKEEMAEAPGEATVALEVVELVAKLGGDADCVFQEGDDDEEASDGGDMGLDGLSDPVDDVLQLARVVLEVIHGRE